MLLVTLFRQDAAGDALTAAAGDVVMGYAKEAGVDGQIIAIELIQGGKRRTCLT